MKQPKKPKTSGIVAKIGIEELEKYRVLEEKEQAFEELAEAVAKAGGVDNGAIVKVDRELFLYYLNEGVQAFSHLRMLFEYISLLESRMSGFVDELTSVTKLTKSMINKAQNDRAGKVFLEKVGREVSMLRLQFSCAHGINSEYVERYNEFIQRQEKMKADYIEEMKNCESFAKVFRERSEKRSVKTKNTTDVEC